MSQSTDLVLSGSISAAPPTCEQFSAMEYLDNTSGMPRDLAQRRGTQRAVLRLLMSGDSVSKAAEQSQITRQTIYYWMKHDAAFMCALNAWRQRTRRDARDKMMMLTEKAIEAIHRGLTQGDLRAATMILKAQGLLERKQKPRAGKGGVSKAKSNASNVLLDERRVMVTDMPRAESVADVPAANPQCDEAMPMTEEPRGNQ